MTIHDANDNYYYYNYNKNKHVCKLRTYDIYFYSKLLKFNFL